MFRQPIQMLFFSVFFLVTGKLLHQNKHRVSCYKSNLPTSYITQKEQSRGKVSHQNELQVACTLQKILRNNNVGFAPFSTNSARTHRLIIITIINNQTVLICHTGSQFSLNRGFGWVVLHNSITEWSVSRVGKSSFIGKASLDDPVSLLDSFFKRLWCLFLYFGKGLLPCVLGLKQFFYFTVNLIKPRFPKTKEPTHTYSYIGRYFFIFRCSRSLFSLYCKGTQLRSPYRTQNQN